MKRLSPLTILLLVTLAISIIYWLGLAATPFHPDESTQIFMSGDLEIFFANPSATFHQSTPTDALRQHYRLVDAPLTRILIGLGRLLSGHPPLAVDWNWGQTWEENVAAGALPEASLLLAARLSLAWLFPLSLLMIYQIGAKLDGARSLPKRGSLIGWIALALLATNSLVLLHTRRAMGESALLFTVIFSLWALLYWKKHPWLVAIPLALAFNAKQSAALLALVGLIALFLPTLQPRRFTQRLMHAALYLLLFGGITLLLNPVLWSDPVRVAQTAWNDRQELVNNQVQILRDAAPEKELDTIPKRFLSTLVNLYINQPAIEDVGNYSANIQESGHAYLSNPLHTLLRDTTGAGLLFALSLVGFLVANRDALKRPPAERGDLTTLLLASAAQFIGQVLFIPIYWQRYLIPLVPIACLWSAYCAARLLDKIQRARASAAEDAQKIKKSGAEKPQKTI